MYKIMIGRDDFKLTEMGATINARMGLNAWAAFVGPDDNAAIAGDVAVLAPEVTSVLKALRKNGLDVVAIHHHMTGTQPTVYFLHYCGNGPAEKLATGPLDRVLSLFWVTPNVHNIHHSRQVNETNSNYANLLTVYDRVLGTYTPSDRAARVKYGLDDAEELGQASFTSLVAMPFQPTHSDRAEGGRVG